VHRSPGYLTGSDSLLTARTFFKARGVYLNDGPVPETEFNGKLFGLGPIFAHPNAAPDQSRGGATIAEREDRPSAMGHAHTLSGHSQGSSMGAMSGMMSQVSAVGGPLQQQTPYGQMGPNGAYIRAPPMGQR
jgi:CCR4-NOT transcription complex subunit 7/8